MSIFSEPNGSGRGFLESMRLLVLRLATLTRLGVLASLVGLAGCSSTHDDVPGSSPSLGAAGAEGEAVTCANDERVEPIAGGLVATSQSGISVTFDGGTPEPPGRGDNEWNVTVLDAAGAPLTDVRLVVSAKMPDHGHMSPTTPEATAPEADGHATITGLNLFMAGVWVIEIGIVPADAEAPNESVSFTFCVEG